MAMLKKFKFHLIIAGLMIFEGATMYFVMPRVSSKVQAEDERGGQAAARPSEFFECELAIAKLNNTSDPGVPVQVDYKVYAVVGKQYEGEFKEQIDKKKFRIKEAVATVMRKASYDTLQEPTLTTLKRQIKEAVADVVGRDKEFIDKIVIPEFKTMDI